jgi:protoheme IX farnesyltransferase
VITLAAGFFIGQPFESSVEVFRFILTVISVTALALASGALNQIQEMNADSQMERTKNRPLPAGRISKRFAILLVFFLLLAGTCAGAAVSGKVLALGWTAVISYNGFYTLWWKKKMAFAAIPGAIPGALPILIGFQAHDYALFDPRGIYLFAILFFWQMPHFWVLALKYSNDYDQGGFPTLPVAKGTAVTRQQITLWCLAYAAVAMMGSLFFPLGIFGVVSLLAVSIWMVFELVRFLNHPEQKTWLRFFLSINFSMIAYLMIILADLWSIYLHPTS